MNRKDVKRRGAGGGKQGRKVRLNVHSASKSPSSKACEF